ncbi:MAG: hypothetical protein U9Q70_07600 [Chloroflexota bacterium]|nr:hypothetical protein [Chloroflexota bacterium]
MIYKVSYVIKNSKQPGAIINQSAPPEIDSEIQLGAHKCQIVEIEELLPPQGNFAYLHVTCQTLEPAPDAGDSE